MVAVAWAAGPSFAEDVDWSGYVGIEPRMFLQDPIAQTQPDSGVSWSAVLAPELRREWDDGAHRLTLAPYLRIDADDAERTHADLREANWLHLSEPWTLQVGLGKVFWGVTEARHLVDIVNQTDQVEDVDEEDKLGQPMVLVERWTRMGSFAVLVLPGFRERTFPDVDARLGGTLRIDTDRARYESGARDHRLDVAARWSHAVGNWDVGVSGFYGTSREPLLAADLDSADQPVLVPQYDVIGQVGVDVQFTYDAWLWKLEAVRRSGHGESFAAVVAGVEYTAFALGGAAADLGLLAEYLHDGRDQDAPPTIYDDDLFVGVRLALNDTQGTAILAGAIGDRNGTLAVLEAERRLGEAWKLELEARLFIDVDPDDPFLAGFRNDSFITLRFGRYL